MAHEENRLAQRLLHPQEFILDHFTIDGVERSERLIHQQHRRIDGQRTRDTDALRLPAGKLVRIPVEKMRRLEREQRKQLFGASPPFRRIPSE